MSEIISSDRLKQEITGIVYGDILSGKIDINTPVGNLRTIPLEVNSISDLGMVYQPFKTDMESKEAYDQVMPCFKSFKDHLNANSVPEFLDSVGVKKPKISHGYLYNESPLEPKLNSFMLDQRIVVFPVEKVGRKYGIKLNIAHFDGIHQIGFEYNIQKISATARGYVVKPHQDNSDTGILNALRTPILFSAGKENELGKTAGLSLEFMCTLLEPATTARIIRKYNDTVDSRFKSKQEYIDFLFSLGIKEERTIAKAIVQDWLNLHYENQEPKPNLSSEFDNGFTNLEEVEKAHEHIDEVGILDLVNYYYSTKWNFNNFLNGEFKSLLQLN